MCADRVVLTKRKRKCPRCNKMHNWPTEDKLCEKCEQEWCEEYEKLARESAPLRMMLGL